MSQPDSPGWWAFEGYINYAKPPIPNKLVRDVVRVYWGSSTKQWFAKSETSQYGRPVSMYIGTWTRLHLPWEGS